MFVRRFGRSAASWVKGLIYLDGNGGHAENQWLEGIEISFYQVDAGMMKKARQGESGEIYLYGERLITRKRTNPSGNFGALLDKGVYSIHINIDSLPPGYGVYSPDILVDTKMNLKAPCFVSIPLIKVASIDLEQGYENQIDDERDLSSHTVLKDKAGNKLLAKVNYSRASQEKSLPSSGYREAKENLPGKKEYVHISCGEVEKEVQVKQQVLKQTTLDKLDRAYETGFIDEHRLIRYYLDVILGNDQTLTEYRGNIPIKNASTIIKRIHDYLGRKDADRALVEVFQSRLMITPPELDRQYRSPSGYFKIHYTTSGNHGVRADRVRGRNVPDYIVSIGEAFDRVKSFTCDLRGFREPILEDGKESFDIYVYDLSGKYGITVPTSYYDGGKMRPRTAAGYICIDNSYAASKGFKKSRDDAMKVTAAHEFFHAVQNAYNVDADVWWKEASATWNEDEVYTEINDYLQYLDKFFASPEIPLDQSNYGGVVFAKYLSEHYGGYETIKRVWEMQASDYRNSINAIDHVLKEKDVNGGIARVFDKFTAYNYNPEQYYEEGYLWKSYLSIKNTYSSFPAPVKTERLNHLSSSYYLFKAGPSKEGKALKITVEGREPRSMGFKLQKRKQGNGLCEITEFSIPVNSDRVHIILPDFKENYSEICFIPANLDKSRDDATYRFYAVME